MIGTFALPCAGSRVRLPASLMSAAVSRFLQPLSFYARWRAQLDPSGLRDAGAAKPPEKLLQAIWHHQRVRREALRANDGRRVRVLHPGFWNHEAGPDFRRAVVQFGDDPPVSGDIELDLHPGCWTAHQHDTNPAFQQVILHVVWEHTSSTSTRPAPPAVAIKDHLDAPLEELADWLSSDAPAPLPDALAGQCAQAWRELSPAKREELLRQAALVRLQGKAAALQSRARVAGWEQALWEHLFRALGYKHNPWPMQNLAEHRSRLAESCADPVHWQARLLGVGGLLPVELPGSRNAAGKYLRQLWDHWWRERDAFADCLLPARLWRLGGLRPANHPQRRLALASHWLAGGTLPARLERWFAAEVPDKALPGSLREALQAGDEFWEWHWTLRSARLSKPQPLLGDPRATDLAVNVILPWLWLRAIEGRNEPLRARAESRYLAWPAGEDNAVLKLARQRMLGETTARAFPTAAAQQGLLQIVRDFCDHADALCGECRFPELVRQWGSSLQSY